MAANDLALVADGAVAFLLVVVIGYAITLNRRLKTWHAGSGEMEQQTAALNATLIRAEVAINTLKAVCKDDGMALAAVQKKAQSLRDDLSFLVERGTGLADRLEHSVRGGLNATTNGAAPSPAPEPPRMAARTAATATPPASDRPMSSAERELLKALEAMR